MRDALFDNPNGYKFPFHNPETERPLKGRLVVDMRIMIGDTKLADSHQVIATPIDNVGYLQYER
ncbi:MAG: hypothetical protein NC548_61365 [Lachnospiraceae bacterium]|nr:hypothetical protein [Lachnospiraceae bacterium]